MHYRLFLLVCLILSATAIYPVSGTAAPAETPVYIENELIMKLRAGLSLDQDAHVIEHSTDVTLEAGHSLDLLLAGLGAQSAEALLPGSDTYRVTFAQQTDPVALAARLGTHPAVLVAEPNHVHQMLRTPNDPFVREQWALGNIQAYEAWDITTGDNIIVAVLDTGVDGSHPDMGDKVLPGYNAVTGTDQTNDMNGHGTAVAGLIAARTDNETGIAGMCWGCRILPVKVLNERGSGSDFVVSRGIRWATDAGARIINLSLGTTGDTYVLREAVEYAHSQGVVIVAATGNERQSGNPISYPAAYPQVLAVGGTGNTDTITGFSNTGDYVDIAAPSVGLWTTIVSDDRDYGPPNGTSFSSPYAAGVAALVFSLRPDLANVDVKCVLEASADDQGAPGKDPEYGWGRLNALRAVQLAQEYTGCPLQETPQHVSTVAAAFAPVAPVASSPGLTYFPQTQHTLRGTFKQYWERYGGLPIFGYPISEEFVEQGSDGRQYTVQYFERHRFELHPESSPPYHVQLSRLGALVLEGQGRSWYTFPKGEPAPNCLFFEATGHSLCEPFLSYWQSNGLEFDGGSGSSYAESMALFGQPLSEPQQEEIAPGVFVTVQWFERARMEDHGPAGVLLGLLSSDLAALRGWR
jgi:type VII secretion-associated serine protease mycosin